MIWFFLLSGLFLGWSLGANDAANVFGTAVGSRMVRFKTAACIASLFVILGAVFGGHGTTKTLTALGAVNAMAGSFTVALMAGVTVAFMTRTNLPVSTTQAIVGAIVGWNFFTHSSTDYNILGKIVATWVMSPLISALFAMALYLLFKKYLDKAPIHMLQRDAYTRAGLIVVGALGSYGLGANNIANVMGVFVSASPFSNIDLFGITTFHGTQQLFLLGALAIAVGIFTYSYRMMDTLGNVIFKLTPVLALIVVLAHSMVLLIFASKGLKVFMQSLHLPTLPLVPVSSSQAIIGAILGVGIIKGGRGVNYKLLGKIALGWILTPVVAAACTFVALFFVQNVFEQPVILKTTVPAEQRQEVNAENGNSPTATLPAEINQALGVKEMWSPIFHQPWDSSVYSPISRPAVFSKTESITDNRQIHHHPLKKREE
ncbi:MAG TPA: inorganic phosphate transporter [bacterium]|nr:inorganic phosphate transporter [bacterium]